MGGELPDWLGRWCSDHLGAPPVEVLLRADHMSVVFGLRLADGRSVVVKAREDAHHRAESCVTAQAMLARRGFRCPAPLTPVIPAGPGAGALVAHAESWLPGGDLLRGDDQDAARRYALVFAELMSALAEVHVPPPLPNPSWLPFDHRGSEPGNDAVPDFVVATVTRATARLAAAHRMPRVLGHADFEAQNLRWTGLELLAVFDWDSLAWMPEPVLVGAAAAAFSSAEQPGLAPVESSAAFIETYQEARARSFEADEIEVAWAASLLTATVNARHEALFNEPLLTTEALLAQAGERLALAGA